MPYLTGSQWSSFKSGVTLSRFDFFQDEPCGVALWIFCMCAICSSATPANVALQ